MSKTKLGYNYLLQDKNDEDLYSLNSSISELMKTNSTLNKFKSIEFEICGNFIDNDLKLVVNYSINEKENEIRVYSSHVDTGAISLSSDFVKAYFGEEKYESLKDLLEEGSIEYEYLKENEQELLNQLAKDYLLMCSPNTNNGSEFSSSDNDFFEELLQSGEYYDEKVELNEYIEKFSEVKPLLDQICEQIKNERILVENDGCSEILMKKVVKFLENHDLIVITKNKK